MADGEGIEAEAQRDDAVSLVLHLKDKRPIATLVTRLSEIGGVVAIATLEDEHLN